MIVGALALTAGPSAADNGIGVGSASQSGGATPGLDGIRVAAGLHGGAGGGRSYPSCRWQRVWPGGGGATSTAGTGNLFGLGDLFRAFTPFNDAGDVATVEVVPAADADKNGDGQIDEEFVVPILGGDGGDVIGEVENISAFNEVILKIVGPQQVGVFTPDPNGEKAATELTPEEKAGQQFVNNVHYPLIQRGTDPFTGEDLWWDPWFVALEDQTASCQAGLVYSPRTSNPRIVLPDLEAFVIRMLPPAQPILRPLDKDHGWAYVQVPTDFAVSAASLTPQTAHAEVGYIAGPGAAINVWAQIEAFPTHLIYKPGDGSAPVTCPLSQMRYNATTPGACSYVYLDSSAGEAGGKFQASVSVAWVGRYTDSAGTVRLINLAPRTTTFGVAVAEARPVGQVDGR